MRFFLRGRRILFARRAFRAVARAGSAALLDAARVKFAPHNGILHTDVFHATAAQQHDRVLLEVMALARDVGGYFHAVGQPDTSDFADGGVRFPRRLGGYLSAHAPLEGGRIKGRAIRECIKTAGERRHGRLGRLRFTTFLRKLIDGSHGDKRRPEEGRRQYKGMQREMQTALLTSHQAVRDRDR